MKEIMLAKGSFGKAKELSGKLAVIKQILNLIIMQKNSHPTDADMGVDIESYIQEFASAENSTAIINAIKTQIEKYIQVSVLSIDCNYVGVGVGKTLLINLTFKYDGVTSTIKLDFENYSFNKQVKLYG